MDPSEHILPFNLQNTSSQTCQMYGYPGVDVIGTNNGEQFTTPVPRDGDSSAEQEVTLAPNAYAQFTLSYTPAANVSFQIDPKSLVITPPNTYNQISFPLNLGSSVTFEWNNQQNSFQNEEKISPIGTGPQDPQPN